MKKVFRRIAALLALCMALTMLPPVALAAGDPSFQELLQKAKDGDTIHLNGSVFAKGGDNDAPLIIDKAVTIEGGSLTLRTGGIVLGADVTFRNTTLSFSSNIRNAIVANGHTLTLDDVKAGNLSFNLFCGGLIFREGENLSVPAPGDCGKIVICGNTSLQNTASFGSGNIYAGNLAMGVTGDASNGGFDAPGNVFAGDAVISIGDGSDFDALGMIYACGAQQRTPGGQIHGKVTLPDFAQYTVSGDVQVGLFNAAALGVAGTEKTAVTYDSSHRNMTTLSISGVSDLAVRSGHLALDTASDLQDAAALSVAPGATLNLSEYGRPLNVGSFAGGGSLILDEENPLIVSGSVTGKTTVGVGSINDKGNSSGTILEGRTCVIAASAAEGAFTLAPNAARPGMVLVLQEGGQWITKVDLSVVDPVVIESFELQNNSADLDVPAGADPYVYVPMPTEYVRNNAPLLDYYTIPLTIRVNGMETAREVDEDYGYLYYYSGIGTATMWTTYLETDSIDSPIDALAVSFPGGKRVEGRFIIEVTVPGDRTASGQDLTATAVLTVGSPKPTIISEPAPVGGLRWTGEEQVGVEPGVGYTLTGNTGIGVGAYTAIARLEDGFEWEGDTFKDKYITWTIFKAAGPAAPALWAVAPSGIGFYDGKIVGTTSAMEYAAGLEYTEYKPCEDGETSVAAGHYYVRYKETNTHEAGQIAEITVPECGAATVTAVAVNSTGHKTEYRMGDTLDVGGLTLEATYSDGSKKTVPVTSNMVSGFDAARPAEDQVLTIRYESCTTTYTIQVLHVHNWRNDWAKNDTHHWHECDAAGCDAVGDAQKDGYAAHDFSAWIVDQAPGAYQAGRRHHTCTVCGQSVSETIPATGGGGGSSSSSGGGNKGSNTQTETHPDGSQTTVVTKPDGTIITTETAVDGSTVETTAAPDGSSRVETRRADGAIAVVDRDAEGKIQAEVRLATASGGTLPLPPLPADGVTKVTVHTGSSQDVSVSIPVRAAAPGIVALQVLPDGSEVLLKTAIVTGRGLTAPLPDGATVRLADRATRFADAAGHWAGDAITFAASRELLTGTAPATFAPDAAMTRAMLVTALARLDGADLTGGGAWYAPALSWAAAKGVSDGSAPGAPITREQLAVMLYRYAGAPGSASALTFQDAGQVHPYAREAMAWAVEHGILTGFPDGALRPTAGATRAQVATMLSNYVANIVNG